MKSLLPLTSVGLLTTGLLFVAAQSASAFTSFGFTTNKTGNDPRADIMLNSVTFGGTTVSDFSLVTGADIIHNDSYHGGNSGSASSDRGDIASGINVEDPTDANVVTSLGNLNLNNIIDNEDNPTLGSTIDVFFDNPLNTLFLWERGMNSDLLVEALSNDGLSVLSSILINRADWLSAGYRIDTTEIPEGQAVGSLGLSLGDVSATRFRLTASAGFNGADYKVVGAKVPEPATLLGLGLVAGALGISRRQSKVS